MTDSTRGEPDEPTTHDDDTVVRSASSDDTMIEPMATQPIGGQPADSDATMVQPATVERPTTSDQPVSGRETATAPMSRTQSVRGSHAVGKDDLSSSSDSWRQETEARRRAVYGGLNWGAALFGWLVAIGLTVLLSSIAAATAAAVDNELDFTRADLRPEAGTIAIWTAVILLAVLVIAYFAGGYVAGRMSRYDGGRQGIAVWLVGLTVTIIVVLIGVLAGEEYDVIFRQVNLPSIPVPTDTLTTGALITLAAVLLATLLAAFLGGKTGERYHRKIDRITA